MKYLRRAAACLAAALCLGGCQQGPVEPSEADPAKFSVGAVFSQEEDDCHAALAQAVTAALEDTGMQLTAQASDGLQVKQNYQIQQMLQAGLDALAVNLQERSSADQVIALAQEEEVPVVFFGAQPLDGQLESWENAYYVGTDLAEAGRLSGEALAQLWQQNTSQLDTDADGVLSLAILRGRAGDKDSVLYAQGVIEALEEAGVSYQLLENQAVDWDRNAAAKAADDLVDEYGASLEAVFCGSDDIALGAAQTLEAYGYFETENGMPTPVFGVGSLPEAQDAVRAGRLYATVDCRYEEIGDAVAELCFLAACGYPGGGEYLNYTLEGQSLFLTPQLMTQEELGELEEETPAGQSDIAGESDTAGESDLV